MEHLRNSNILKGKIIICTHPQKEEDDFIEIVSPTGAEVHFLPMIEITPLPFKMQRNISAYNWLIFTSKNGVSAFLKCQQPVADNKIAALGPMTAAELTSHGYCPDFVGSGKSGKDFAGELSSVIPAADSVLLALGNLAPDILQESLSPQCRVERVNVYETTLPKQINQHLLNQIEEDNYDLLIISSPSAIKNLHACLSKNRNHLRLISIGETTTAAIRKLGLQPLATARETSYRGLAEITIEYLQQHKNI